MPAGAPAPEEAVPDPKLVMPHPASPEEPAQQQDGDWLVGVKKL